MTRVPTVRGDVDSNNLGRTYMHEHIFVLTADVQNNYPREWGDESARINDAITELDALAAAGVRTIVDLTVIGLGRYIPRIQRIAAQVDLQIIVATGCYTYDDVPFYFRHRHRHHGTADPMTQLFVEDIVDGIAGTGVRAGMLKCAIDRKGLRPGVERVMRAVAAAHRATNTPITVHTHPGTQQGRAVHRVMTDEGVPPERVVLGHSGDTTDADHLQELAELGYYLGMDRFGLNTSVTFEQRADIVVEMCRRGFASQLVLSHDASCYIDWMDAATAATLPDWHYLHLSRDVIPYLKAHGVTDEQLTTMLVDNPRRIFETR